MATLRHMVSLLRTEEEKEHEVETMKPTAATLPDVPWGLRICLTQDELKKLDIDYGDCEIGDTIHIFAMAEDREEGPDDDEEGE